MIHEKANPSKSAPERRCWNLQTPSSAKSSTAGLWKANNLFGNSAAYPTATDVSIKVDRRISDRQSMFARFSLLYGGNQQPNFFGNVASPNFRTGLGHLQSGAYDHTFYARGWVLHELPIGQGRLLLNRKGVTNALVGGWRLSGIVTSQSGSPISVTSTPNTTGSYGGG